MYKNVIHICIRITNSVYVFSPLETLNVHQLYPFSVSERHSTVSQWVWWDQHWQAVVQFGNSGRRAHTKLAEPFRICSCKFPSLCWWSHGWKRICTWKSLRSVHKLTDKNLLEDEGNWRKVLLSVELPFEGWGGTVAELGERNRSHRSAGVPSPAKEACLQWHVSAFAVQSSRATFSPSEKKKFSWHYGISGTP